MSWRGLLASRSAAALRRLGLSARFLSLASAVALERGTWIISGARPTPQGLDEVTSFVPDAALRAGRYLAG